MPLNNLDTVKYLTAAEYLQLVEGKKKKGKSKYGNVIVKYDSKKFDSKKEKNRYKVLKLAEKSGHITDLQTQVVFELIPKSEHFPAITYRADFTYYETKTKELDKKFGFTLKHLTVEDSKGCRTAVYKLKRIMMWHFHKIIIKET